MALAECYLPQGARPAVEAPFAAAMPSHRPLSYLKAHHHKRQYHRPHQTSALPLPLPLPLPQLARPPTRAASIPCVPAAASAQLPQPTWPPAPPPPPAKDYSIPLHVDCSVEYELPDCAKPPQGVKVEPLLMIHPAHFRRLDSLRRCPFVNNLPAACSLPPPDPRIPATPSRVPRRAEWRRPSCCGVSGGEPWLPMAVAAPREGDTLENSGFGKCVRGYAPSRSARQAAHPYLADLPVAAADCDKTVPGATATTFRMTQGAGELPVAASPYRSEVAGIYRNYPIVMYK